MFGIPLLAFVIYLWVFFGGVAGIAYGYSQWRRHGAQKDLNLLLLGLVAIVYVVWGLISRYLIITNSGDTAALLWARNVLALVALVVGLSLLFWQRKGSENKKQ